MARIALDVRLAATLILLLTSFPPAAVAQVATAQLLGTVRDSTGASVIGAKVTLTGTRTNVSTSAQSDSEGNYLFPSVLPSEYKLEVAAAGFKRFERTGIVLTVNQKARVDVSLEIGQLTETINVQANAELINTVDGELGHTVVQKNIVDLPLKGRQFIELAFLTPGAVNAPGDYRASMQGIAPAVNGNRPEANQYTLNGANNTDLYDGFFVIQPSVDSVEEFKIQSGTYNAEYGRAGGAIINVVTKSGSNSFHGTAYEFVRNDHLNSRNFFNPTKSPVKQNQFGVTFGGPLLIPGAYNGKNKTFFFFNYEGFRERRASTISSRFPTQTELSGDLAGFAAPVIDPASGASRTPFPNNRVPADRFDPISVKYNAIFPQVNSASNVVFNFINNQARSTTGNSYGGRLDHNFSERDRLFGTVNWNDLPQFRPSTIPNGPGEEFFSYFNKLINVTHTHTFNPNMVNEVRVTYNRLLNPEQQTYPLKNYAQELGFVNVPQDPNIRDRWPGISYGQGISGVTRSYEFTEITNTYTLQDNLSWIVGRHQLKFGFSGINTRTTFTFVANAPFTFAFGGNFSGNAIADYLMGLATSNTSFLLGGRYHLNNANIGFYAQDQWRVTPRLTLNYGIRYEAHTPYTDPGGTAGSLNPRTGALIVTSNAPDVSEFARLADVTVERLNKKSLYDGNYWGLDGPIMPRFGFSYQMPGSKAMVVRGGYGLSLNTEIGNVINGGLAPPFWVRPGNSTLEYPGIGWNRDRASFANLATVPLDSQPILANFKEGYVQSWNLTLEKQVHDHFLTAGYVGSKGTHLAILSTWNEAPPGPGDIRLRRPLPRFGTFSSFENFGAHNYHALQTKAERRLAGGLNYLVSYTWSKGIGNTGTLNETRIPTTTNMRSARGLVPFDVRQRFTASLVYELPFGHGKKFASGTTGAVNALIGGWQLTNIYAAQTGYPVNLSVSPCQVNGGAFPCPPNATGQPQSLSRGERNLNQWFNTAAFAAPPPFTIGNWQVWSLEGPTGLNNFDTAFMKNTTIREGYHLQFRAEFFNLFNHTQFSGVGTTLGSAQFGRITSTKGEREVQLALKLIF